MTTGFHHAAPVTVAVTDIRNTTLVFVIASLFHKDSLHLPDSSSHTDELTSVKRSHPVSSHDGKSAILHSTTQERQNVFLKTAIAQISSTNCSSDDNSLFDEGSQRSFITESMTNRIQLERTGTKEVHIASFGTSTQNVRHFDTAPVYLHTALPAEFKTC